jgi:hypothetical protein
MSKCDIQMDNGFEYQDHPFWTNKKIRKMIFTRLGPIEDESEPVVQTISKCPSTTQLFQVTWINKKGFVSFREKMIYCGAITSMNWWIKEYPITIVRYV